MAEDYERGEPTLSELRSRNHRRQVSHRPYVTVYESIGGWKAVQMWWNPDMGGFWEPWQTGCGAYATQAEAEVEARNWAEDEEMPYVPNQGVKP